MKYCNLKSLQMVKGAFLGTQDYNEGMEVATMEYWVRLRVPMEQAIRLFKVRP